MKRLLLTYNAPMLLTYVAPKKRNWIARVLSALFVPITVVMASMSCLFVIDSIDSKPTNAVMNGVYQMMAFFAPDMPLFQDNYRLGFVSIILNADFRYIKTTKGVSHMLTYDQCVNDEGALRYTLSTGRRVMSPSDCVVKSVDMSADGMIVSLYIDDRTVMSIQTSCILSLKEGQRLMAGQLLGTMSPSDTLSVSIYVAGIKSSHPFEDVKWLRLE